MYLPLPFVIPINYNKINNNKKNKQKKTKQQKNNKKNPLHKRNNDMLETLLVEM